MVKYLCEGSDFKSLTVKGKIEEENKVLYQTYKKFEVKNKSDKYIFKFTRGYKSAGSAYYNKKKVQVQSDTKSEYLINQRLSKIPEIIKIMHVEYDLEKHILKRYTNKFKGLSKVVKNKSDLLVYEYYDEIQLIKYLNKLKTIEEVLECLDNVCNQLFTIMEKIYKIEPGFYFCQLTPYNIFIDETTMKIKISDLNHGSSILSKKNPILNHLLFSDESIIDLNILGKVTKNGINSVRRSDLYIFFWYIFGFLLNNKKINSKLSIESLNCLKNKFLISLFSNILKFSISVNGKSKTVENLLKIGKLDKNNIQLVFTELFQYCNTKPLDLSFIKTIKY